MANSEDKLCLRCEHPKSEHVNNGCNHLDDMGRQPHGNREEKLCDCDGFRDGAVGSS
jgi:hypothetical protein